MLSTCSKGRYKLSHWGRNEAIRHDCDGFLMRLFVLGQQVTLVLSQIQERDGERSREEGRREAEQELGAGSWPAGYRKGAKLCILFSTFIKRTFLGKHPKTNVTIS